VLGINDGGELVGDYSLTSTTPCCAAGTHGFLRSRGHDTTIDYPNAVLTYANGINERGEIIGAYNDGVSHGFYLHRDSYAPIDHPGATFTNALGINSRGEIVGRYVDAAGGRHGYVLKRGEFTTVDYPGATFTGVTAIDGEGNIVGRTIVDGVFHGFVLSRGEEREGQRAGSVSQ
jgi:uncharacterized membrane protein